jgi:uncharacterized protein (TIGR02266 family)
MSGQDDRRSSARIPAELRVEFRHLGRPHESFSDISRDISNGGIFIDTSVGLEVGTEVSLDISPGPSALPIRLQAEVVRVEEELPASGSSVTVRVRGMALRFVGAPSHELARLLGLVEYMVEVNGDGGSDDV